MLPYKSSCFQRVVLVLLPILVDQPPSGFPNRQQAGIELLRSFSEIFKETGGLSCFSSPRSSRTFYKIFARFIRRHIPFVKTPQTANNIRYILQHNAFHSFSDSCFHTIFFLFPCPLFASLPGRAKFLCCRQSERILRRRFS